MTVETLETEIRDALRRYRVRMHYIGTREAKATRYAVFTEAGQLAGPRSHAECRAQVEDLIVADLLKLIRAEITDLTGIDTPT